MNRILDIDELLLDLFDKQDRIQNEIIRLRKERTTLASESIKQELSVHGLNDITHEKYMRVRKWVELDHATYLIFAMWLESYAEKGVSRDGTRSNGQALLYVHLDVRKPFEDQLAILDFLPYIEPCKDEGEKIESIQISILEHTCSEHGNYRIQIIDNRFQIVRKFNSIDTIESEENNITDCLKNVYQNHWLYSDPSD